ncbi:MAG: hypothetical protein CTY22_03690 [Methylomonas sp.]|nr:MAG: hypothetical protein CTY23_01955 [Methylomonas sp.]PPD26849.1 MAG: hypothetical protein CTY22_03690 [Methylomonas sp.]PPD38756.1 MAG: hypothetical protein CTY21_03690 [Methylomonas sp.]PPD40200.1 MAG: hypothetical protein CTY17_07075 [Methylomonas sp.]PPD53547.1 MAG: hypothetical protein CTY11_05620 [Methylomonas sp.]
MLINSSNNLVTLKDGQGRWQIANHVALSVYGLNGKPWQGKTDRELARLCEPLYQPYFRASIESDERAWQSSLTLTEVALPNAVNGFDIRTFEIVKNPLFEADGSRKALVVFGLDITDKLEKERQIRLTDRVLAHSDEAVLISDQNNDIVYVNEAFTRITGYTQDEIKGKNPRILSSRRQDRKFYDDMWRQITTEGSWHGEIWDRRKNGEVYPKWLNISCVRDDDGRISNYIGIFTDISKAKADEELLAFLAYHDPLTRLPNRLMLRDRFYQATGEIARRNGGSVALLFLDLDQFKAINDSLGHETGDRFLVAVAHRLQSCVREVDTVSRLGGDEFVIVLSHVSDTHSVSIVAQKILDHLSAAFDITPHRLTSSASIGIALYPDDGDDFETVLKVADTAMYNAKDCGRNTYRFYTDKMNIDAMERLRMRTGLSEAIRKQEFVLHYQPQFDLDSGKMIGLEALIRWQHPKDGLIYPGKFIPVAEETGQIVPIGEWVINEACRQAKQWQDAGYPPVTIAVNLSALQFKRGDVVKMVANLTRDYGLLPEHLELELTETIMLQDVDYIIDVIDQLKSLRFTLSVDDFGTGYSSLSYLKRFKVDKLKIDHSFVRNLEVDDHDVAIVRTIIQLAHNFGLRAIAEGVETPGQLDILRREGCNEAQGYLFSYPLTPAGIEKLFTV